MYNTSSHQLQLRSVLEFSKAIIHQPFQYSLATFLYRLNTPGSCDALGSQCVDISHFRSHTQTRLSSTKFFLPETKKKDNKLFLRSCSPQPFVRHINGKVEPNVTGKALRLTSQN